MLMMYLECHQFPSSLKGECSKQQLNSISKTCSTLLSKYCTARCNHHSCELCYSDATQCRFKLGFTIEEFSWSYHVISTENSYFYFMSTTIYEQIHSHSLRKCCWSSAYGPGINRREEMSPHGEIDKNFDIFFQSTKPAAVTSPPNTWPDLFGKQENKDKHSPYQEFHQEGLHATTACGDPSCCRWVIPFVDTFILVKNLNANNPLFVALKTEGIYLLLLIPTSSWIQRSAQSIFNEVRVAKPAQCNQKNPLKLEYNNADLDYNKDFYIETKKLFDKLLSPFRPSEKGARSGISKKVTVKEPLVIPFKKEGSVIQTPKPKRASGQQFHLQFCRRQNDLGNKRRMHQNFSSGRRKENAAFGGWSEWCTRLVFMVAVWTCAGKWQVHALEGTDICQRNNITADQICDSMDLRNEINALDALCKCRIINGHLHFVLQEKKEIESLERLQNYTFPGLQEITHHLLVFRVFHLTTFRRLFPNLAVIRGDVLFHNYALVIYGMANLREVGLVSLTVILRGSVRIERNPKLCYVHTVDWNNITVSRVAENYINRNRAQAECPQCNASLQCHQPKPCGSPRCWGPDDCQYFCGQKCFGGCDGDDCCHKECLGGCSRPNDSSACHACRKLLEDGTCVSECSSGKYKVLDQRCEDKSFCVSRSKWKLGSPNGYILKHDTQECIKSCLSGYNEIIQGNISVCEPCKDGECPKICNGSTVSSVLEAQWFRACKIVNGSLNIQISGGVNIERELEENLGTIEEVKGYVRIFRSNVTSLNFLKNLTRIGGNEYIRSNYSLEILDNRNLQTIWNWTERSPNFTIVRGKVFAQSNPKLCLEHIRNLTRIADIGEPTDTDVSKTSNGDKMPCNVTSLKAQIQLPSLYGTLSVKVIDRFPWVTNYYFNYKETDKNISLYESEGPCSDTGWSRMEGRINPDRVFTIINLKPFTRYAVYVKTYLQGTNTKSAQSEIMYGTTIPFNPTEPLGLEAIALTSRSLDISWGEPRSPNGIIDHYLVTLELLKDIPRIPSDFKFCETKIRVYVDNMMRAKASTEKTQNAERISKVTKRKSAKGQMSYQERGDGTCPAEASSSSCCPCPSSANAGDLEVIGQIQFEDFIMDNVYFKKLTACDNANHYGKKISAHQCSLEADFSIYLATIRRQRSVNSSGYALYNSSDNTEFPIHHSGVLFEFPSEGDIQENYTDHVEAEDLAELEEKDPDDKNLVTKQVKMSRETSLTVDSLRHFSLYSVTVVACQKPIFRTKKLCSSVPAQKFVFTRHDESVDMIYKNNLAVTNTSRDTVEVRWRPPLSPNGGVVAYLINLQQDGITVKDECVDHKEFEHNHRIFTLRDLPPGNYSIRVQVRSKARYGNYSSPEVFAIPEDDTRAYISMVVISSLLVVAGALGAAVICWSWKRYRSRYRIPDTLDKVDINPYYREGFAPAEIFREEFIFWRDDLKVFHDEALGKGYFGMVFEGDLRRNGRHMKVAVKTHNESATTDDIRQFLKEAAVMQNIKCHHVVQLLGVVGDYSPVYVVMELMEEGDLKTYLKKHSNDISGQKLVEMATEAADGMAYLSAAKLVHRDLAARNCMLDHKLTLKIGDFGLSRNLNSDYYRKEGQGVLPVKWMAPESLQFSVYTTQSDVWSYGVLLWEMATRGVTPYKNCTNDEVIRLVVDKYVTLGRPRNCPIPLKKLMRRCWKYESKERPTFLSITKFLLKHTSEDYQHHFEQVSFFHERLSDYSRYNDNEKGGFMSERVRENEGDDSDNLALLTSSDQSDTESPQHDFTQIRFEHGLFNESRSQGNRHSFPTHTCSCEERQAARFEDPAASSLLNNHPFYFNFVGGEASASVPLKKNVGFHSSLAVKSESPSHLPPNLVIPVNHGQELPYAQLQLSSPITPASVPPTPSTVTATPVTCSSTCLQVPSILGTNVPWSPQSTSCQILPSAAIFPTIASLPCTCPQNISASMTTASRSHSVSPLLSPGHSPSPKVTACKYSELDASSLSSDSGEYYNMHSPISHANGSSTMVLPPTPSRVTAIQPFSICSAKNQSHDSITGYEEDYEEDIEDDDDDDDDDDDTDDTRDLYYIDKRNHGCSLGTMVSSSLTTDDSYLSRPYGDSQLLDDIAVPQCVAISRNNFRGSRYRKLYENTNPVSHETFLDEMNPLSPLVDYSQPKPRKAVGRLGVVSLPGSRSTTLSRSVRTKGRRKNMSSLEDFELL